MEQVKFTYKDHNQTSSSKVNGAFTFQKFFFFFFFFFNPFVTAKEGIK